MLLDDRSANFAWNYKVVISEYPKPVAELMELEFTGIV